MITMSTNEIKAFGPCVSGWKRLLTGLNKLEADDEQIPFVKFLETNTIDEVFWAMRVKWFQHKEAFMNVINAAVERTAADAAYAAADAARVARAAFYAANTALYAARAAAAFVVDVATDATNAADYANLAAYYAANAAASAAASAAHHADAAYVDVAYLAELEQQKQDIIKFCS